MLNKNVFWKTITTSLLFYLNENGIDWKLAAWFLQPIRDSQHDKVQQPADVRTNWNKPRHSAGVRINVAKDKRELGTYHSATSTYNQNFEDQWLLHTYLVELLQS